MPDSGWGEAGHAHILIHSLMAQLDRPVLAVREGDKADGVARDILQEAAVIVGALSTGEL